MARARRTFTGLLAALALLSSLVLGAGPAAAGPVAGLCNRSDARGAAPDNFAIDVCTDGQRIWLRNNLSVPVTLAITGDSTGLEKVTLDGSIAAVLTRAVTSDPNVLMPSDVARVGLGQGEVSVTLANTNAGGTYIEMSTLSAFMPVGAALSVYDAIANAIVEFDQVMREEIACEAGKNLLQVAACRLVAQAKSAVVFGKMVVVGVAKGALSLMLNTVTWAQLITQQVPDVATLLKGERTIQQVAAPPPPAPEPAPVVQPPPAAQAPPPPPAPEPQPEPQAPSRPIVETTINDAFYGGTWARGGYGDGTWYTRSNKPSDAAYWYPNGLGVALDCAYSGAAYKVKWLDGHIETWTWWGHVTDGKWVPVAVLDLTGADGSQGLAPC